MKISAYLHILILSLSARYDAFAFQYFSHFLMFSLYSLKLLQSEQLAERLTKILELCQLNILRQIHIH